MGSLEDYLFLKESCFVLSKTKRLKYVTVDFTHFPLISTRLDIIEIKIMTRKERWSKQQDSVLTEHIKNYTV